MGRSVSAAVTPEVVGEVARVVGQAHQDAHSQTRHWFDHVKGLLDQREEVIKSQQSVIQLLQDRYNKIVSEFEKIADKTASIVLLTAKKDIEVERVKGQTSENIEMLKLLQPFTAEITRRLQPEPLQVGLPAGARRALQRLFESDALCRGLRELAGAEDYTALLRWAAEE